MSSLDLIADLYGIGISIKKSKVIKVITRVTTQEQIKLNITLQGKKLEQLDNFKYLNVIPNQTGKCDKKIDKRIGQRKTSFNY